MANKIHSFSATMEATGRGCAIGSLQERAYLSFNLKRIESHQFMNREIKCMWDSQYPKSSVARAKDFFFTNSGA